MFVSPNDWPLDERYELNWTIAQFLHSITEEKRSVILIKCRSADRASQLEAGKMLCALLTETVQPFVEMTIDYEFSIHYQISSLEFKVVFYTAYFRAYLLGESSASSVTWSIPFVETPEDPTMLPKMIEYCLANPA